MQSLCEQHNLAIPERVRVELCESCGAFVYWSPLNESTQSESSLNNNTTALLVTRAKVRLKRAQKYPKTLNHLVQSERKKLSTTQQQSQRIYIRNFLEITCGVCQHKTRIVAFRNNPKQFLHLNRKKSSDTKQKTETKTSKKRRLSGISNGKPSKKSKIQTMTSLRGSVFSSSKTKQKKMKKKKKKETLQSLIQAQIQRTQTQEKETFTLHDFLKEIQW